MKPKRQVEIHEVFFCRVCKTLNLRRLRVIDVPTWHMAFTSSLKHHATRVITKDLQTICCGKKLNNFDA